VIKSYEYKNDFARRYVQQGRGEGRRELARDAILAIAAARLGGLDKADVERIARAMLDGVVSIAED